MGRFFGDSALARPLLAGLLGAVWLLSTASSEAEAGRTGGAESPRHVEQEPPEHGLRVVLDERRFAVRGETPETILGDVEARRIGDRAGLVAHGLASYRVEPRWTFFATDRQCFMDAVGIDVDVVVDLPRWHGYATAEPQVQAWWHDYLAELTAHEYAHRDAVLAAMGDLHRELTFLSASDCGALNRSARTAMQRTWDALQEAQESLDRAFEGRAPIAGA